MGIEAFDEALVDGGGGFAVELLIDDGLGEGLKRGLLRGDAHGQGANAGDKFGEFEVSGRERGDGSSGVIRRALSAGGVRAGHEEDDTAVICTRKIEGNCRRNFSTN